MKRAALILLLCPAVVASSAAQQLGNPLQAQLRQARSEQAAAEAETAKLEQAAANARGQAGRLRADQAAAAQAIAAAEARITTADAELRLTSTYVAAHRRRLAEEQRPVSALLAGLAVMGRRPPLVALAAHGSTDELVKIRILLDSTLPVIRSRTGRLSAQLADAEQLELTARNARAELGRSRQDLIVKRQRFASLERRVLQQALASSGAALSTGDVAIAAGENLERLRTDEASSRSARMIALQLAAEPPPPLRPLAADGALPSPGLAYQLPATAAVIEGLAAVNDSGVRSRGIALATSRGSAVTAPADGTVRFSGPFRNYDGVLIIDHGGGWVSLLVNVAAQLRPGDRVRLGQPIGRALGPLQVELSHRGRRISPALIAGSSVSLSKQGKGG